MVQLRTALLLILTSMAWGQNTSEENFHVYRDSPRILLTPARLRLLQRERERQSIRWEQFDKIMSSGAAMPEPGFAWALYYRVAGDAAAGRKAIEWALTDAALTDSATDLRQLALVFDWCGPLLNQTQAGRISAKLERGVSRSATDVRGQTARALAAIALADRLPDQGDAVLREIVQKWWRAKPSPAIPQEEIYSLYELLHILRDNLKIDLRESAAGYFRDLPFEYLAAHYPAPFRGPANDFRIPVYLRDGNPSLAEAALSRAAGLAMVAYDNNAIESQYLQGWLIQDRFLMRDALGAAYEFLWANPYQPGLPYDKVPLVFHDAATSRVFARSSWDEDASWIGYFDGRLQLFQNGRVQTLPPGASVQRLRMGEVTLDSSPSEDAARFRIDGSLLLVFGLAPRAAYDVEIDGQTVDIRETDAAGTLAVLTPGSADVRIKRRLR